MSAQFKQPAVLFDLYSTLVEEQKDNPFYPAMIANLSLPEAFWPAYLACGSASMIGHVDGMAGRILKACGIAGCERDTQTVYGFVDAHIELFQASVQVYEDTFSALQQVTGMGLNTALVSNASSYSLPIIHNLGLNDFFDAMSLSYQLGVLKPDKAIYLDACTRLGVSPENCIYVGDGGDKELLGAHDLGMTTILVNRNKPHTASARQHAKHEVRSLTHAINIVEILMESKTHAFAC
ncbi:hypothetical protein ROS1_57880 [Roseibium sp. ROS1]